MKCPKCGYLLPDDSDFCQYCGIKLDVPEKETVPQMVSVAAWPAPANSSASFNQTIASKKISNKKNAKQRYCKLCGGAIDSNTKKCSSCGKQYFKLSIKPVVLVIIALFVAAAGYIGYNYFKAIDSMNNQEFIASKQYFDNLFVSDRLFKDMYAYVEAGVLMEEGKYIDALHAFQDLDFFVPSIMEDLKWKIYEQGQAYYREGNNKDAETCFAVLNGYRRSADYMTLIATKTGSSLNYDKLLNLLGFEDTNKIIITNRLMSAYFLTGTWEDNFSYYKKYFTMTEVGFLNYQTTYNLPCIYAQGGFYLIGGIYSIGETIDTAVKCFRFEIIGNDIISVYCYKDGSTYTLYRQ